MREDIIILTPQPEGGEKDRLYNTEAREVEKILLHESFVREQILRRVQNLRLLKKHTDGRPDFFEAVLTHETANLLYDGFLVFLGQEAAKQGKTIDELERQEIQEIFLRFPDRDALDHAEQKAIDLYESSVAKTWISRETSVLDAKLLKLDILTRRAERITNDAEHQSLLDVYEKKLLSLIAEIETPGIRAEYQLIWLMRRWIRDRGLDHIIHIEHGSPRDDKKLDIDLIIYIEGQKFNLSIKTLSEDSYRDEFNAKIVAAARQKSATGRNYVLVISSSDLSDAFRLQKERTPDAREKSRLNAVKRRIIRSIDGQFPESWPHEKLLAIVETERPRKTREKITKRQIERLISVDALVAFGLLASEERGNIEKIIKLKRKFVEASPGIIANAEDIANPGDKTKTMMREAIKKQVE